MWRSVYTICICSIVAQFLTNIQCLNLVGILILKAVCLKLWNERECAVVFVFWGQSLVHCVLSLNIFSPEPPCPQTKMWLWLSGFLIHYRLCVHSWCLIRLLPHPLPTQTSHACVCVPYISVLLLTRFCQTLSFKKILLQVLPCFRSFFYYY